MALRKPGAKKVGVKVLGWGKKGSGKSVFALTFPGVAAIDAEAGLAFYEGGERGKNLVLVSNTQSFKEMEDDFDEIREDHEELGVKTLAIDSETKIYENVQETVMTVEERRARKAGRDVDDTNLSQRSWGRIKYVSKRLQNLKIDLSSNGVNIVSIAQHDDIKEKQGDQFVIVGGKPVMAKGAEYDYDIVLYFFTEENEKGETRFYARVDKDRTETFKVGTVIENPNYSMWAPVIDANADKEALKTNFVEQSEESKDRYEEDAAEDERTWTEKVVELTKKLDKDSKTKLGEELKAAKISKFEGLTAKQQEKLEAIYDKFNK